MEAVQKLIKELMKMDIENLVSDALLKLEKKFIALQRGQMKAGKTSEGGEIGDYTSERYIQRRKKRGLITTHVTLHFTGKFYQSLKLEKRGKETWLTTNCSYSENISKRYGIDIYDLNSTGRAKLVSDVAEIVSEKMILNLKT